MNLPLVLGWLAEVGVDALVVSLGVDTSEDDRVGTSRLATADFTATGLRQSSLGVPTVILQEGGYAVDDLGTDVAAFLRGFAR